MTIKRKLEQGISGKEEELALLRQALTTLEGTSLLDIELTYSYISVLAMEGKTWLWIRPWGDPIKARIKLGEIMDALGVTQASKPQSGDCAVIELDGLCIDFELPKLHCQKARVTKTEVIEFCGSLDESKYDSVEYLEEAE